MGRSTTSLEVQLVRENQPGTTEDLVIEIAKVDLPHRMGYDCDVDIQAQLHNTHDEKAPVHEMKMKSRIQFKT